MNKLLCFIGVHNYKQIGFLGIFGCLEQCDRCGIGRGFHPYSGFHMFNKQAMDEIIKNSAAPTDTE